MFKNSLNKISNFAGLGGLGAFLGSLIGFPIGSGNAEGFNFTEAIIRTGIWDGIIAIAIGIAFVLCQNWYLKKTKPNYQELGKIGLRCAIAGFIGGAALIVSRRVLTSIDDGLSLIVAWAVEGLLIGYLIAPVIPNLPKKSALIAGGIAGALGALFMIILAGFGMGAAVSVALGDSLKGIFLGLMLTVTETLVREAWLEIRYNPREVRTVSLGKEPVTIGGNSKLCTVYVPSSPPIAYRYQLQDGKIICEDVVANTTRNLHPGDEQTLGRVTIAVCASASPSTQGMSQSQKAVSELPPTVLSSSQSKPSVEIFLHIKRQVFPLKEGTCLTPQEIPGLESLHKDGIVARVEPNPNNPAVLGLKNCSYRPWNATLPTGEEKVIDSGRSIKLAVGTQINFGPVKGEIK